MLAEHIAMTLRTLADENSMCAMFEMLVRGKINRELQQKALAEMEEICRFFIRRDAAVPNGKPGYDEAQRCTGWSLGGLEIGCVASTAGKNHDSSSTQNPIAAMQQRVLQGERTASNKRRRVASV
jgi:hypothetical protein